MNIFGGTAALSVRHVIIALVVAGAVSSARAEFRQPADDPGPWSVAVVSLNEWVRAQELAEPREVACHLYGIGKYRVSFRTPDATRDHEVDIPAAGWQSFKQQLGPGQVEVKIECVADPKYPKPVFNAFGAVANPDYVPELADYQQPLYLRATNSGPADASISVAGASRDTTRSYFTLGGLSAEGFEPKGSFKAGATSRVINLSRTVFKRTVLTFKPEQGPKQIDVQLAFFADRAATHLLKTVQLKGAPAANESVIFIPQPDGSYRIQSTAELFAQDLSVLEEEMRKDPRLRRPVPVKSRVLVVAGDAGEEMETYRSELRLLRLVGINGINGMGRLDKEWESLGFAYCRQSNFLRTNPQWTFDEAGALSVARGRAFRKGMETILMLTDEPTFYPIAQTPQQDSRFAAWLQERAEVTAATQKQLQMLRRQFEMDEEAAWWNDWGRAFSAVHPKVEPAINWSVDNYYYGFTIDLWEFYRQPGCEVVWGEDWYGYMPRGSGVIAWYADLMRSQAKYRNLPTGSYLILGYGYSPALDSQRYYERMMRGGYTFDTYPYWPRGSDATWLEHPDVLVNMARLHRDLAEVEDILVGGRVLPAKAAIVYPNSCMLWDVAAYQDALALYLAHLHAGIPLDVLTEQDVVDGRAQDYALLYCLGANIRRDALEALDAFVLRGGTLAGICPEARDQFDDPIRGGESAFGARKMASVARKAPGGFAYEFKSAQSIDTVKWQEKEVKVYCRKLEIEPLEGAEVLATFSGGSPAVIQSRRGKGRVILYAFSLGLSYMKMGYGDNKSIPTGLRANRTERDLCILPTRSIENAIALSEPMISGRIVCGATASLVGLVDYAMGKAGRETDLLDPWSVDLEKMEPFRVTVQINCNQKPDDVRAVRAGKVEWDYAAGKLRVQLPLRGVDMLVLTGRNLFSLPPTGKNQ